MQDGTEKEKKVLSTLAWVLARASCIMFYNTRMDKFSKARSSA